MSDRIDLPSSELEEKIFEDAFFKGVSQEQTRWVAAVEGMVNNARESRRIMNSDDLPLICQFADGIISGLEELLTRMEAS